jgi:RHS repeat-associated protein
LYFTIQPGAAYIKVQNPDGPQGAQLYYPNNYNYPPRTSFDFWNYDADAKGWYVYGQGTVSADRTQVVPNPGVVIYEFTGAMVSQPTNAPVIGPKHDPVAPPVGEPVDPGTGLFVYSKTDLVVGDVIPIVLARTYRPSDPTSRAFGIGTSLPYDMFLVGDNLYFPEGYTYQDLILADGSRIHFTRTSPCTGASGYCDYPNAVYTATSEDSSFYGATIVRPSGGGWTLTKKDGTVYNFPDSTGSTNPRAAAVTSFQDRSGNTVTLTRGSNSNLTQITSPNGRWIQFTYDTSNRITLAQDNSGRSVGYTYDGSGRVYTVTDANTGVTTFTYDTNNNMQTIKDARGIVYLTNQYDANNRVYKQTLADSSVYQFAYTLDANNNVTQTNVTDPRGFVRQLVFNSDGYVTNDTQALGKTEQQIVTYTRQPVSGLITSMVDALSRQTNYSYDALGNITSITRLAGTGNAVTTNLSYGAFAELGTITDPLGHATTFSYDTQGNLTAATDPLGNAVSAAYNTAGQPVSVTDPLGNTARLTYDKGDLVAVADPLGRTVNRFVDGLGRLITLTDPLGRITKYAYNPFNEISTITDPLGNQTGFSYDANGNVQTVTDAKTHATQYAYDNMDRVATRKDALLNQESYQYDGNGNLTQFTDRRNKVTTLNYDGLNRRTFAGFGTQAGPTYESTIAYTLDAGNRLTQAVDSMTGTITRVYDGLNRLTSETTPQGNVSYGYDAANRRTSMTAGGQSAVGYAYDNASRLTQITQGSSAVSFSYDGASRRTSLTLPNGVTMSYIYDTGSQLTGISYSLGQIALGNLTYAYDLAGRRVSTGGSYARTGLPQAISTTSYNANNQLTQWGTATPTYDANGNTLSDGTNSYVWNARNQLASMNSGGASFQYDPFGRRVGKTIVGATTNYLYDGANPVQELAGTTPTANLLTGGIDEYFVRTDSSGTANFLTDALGSTLALADPSGNTLASYTYEPFGNATPSGSSASSYQYSGRENDGTGVYFYRARYYSPVLQRFMSEDPMRFSGGDINIYAYVGNSPVGSTDPNGTENPISHFAESFWAGVKDPSLSLGLSDPFSPTSDVLTDGLPHSQDTDAYDANMHAMAGRKSNGQWQTCSQALTGAADFIATQMNGDNLGMAEHTGQDWATPSHGGAPWYGDYTLNHAEGDWITNLNPGSYDARMNNTLWIRQNMLIRTGQPVTASEVLANMQGSKCQ